MGNTIFLDVDGTLVDEYQRMPASTREALLRAQAAGHGLVLCTGRSKREIYPWLLDLGFSGIVGGNGAYVEMDGDVVWDQRLQRHEIVEISQWLDGLGAGWLWQSPDGLNQSDHFLDRFMDATGKGVGGDWSAFATQIAPYLRTGMPETASKLTFTLPSACGLTLDDAREHFAGRYVIVTGSINDSEGEVGELSMLGMSKAIGLEKACEFLGVPMSSTIAIGDSANDVEMLGAAGTGVAMGNSTADARAAADWSTTSIGENGIYNAFEKLGLLG